MKNYKLILTLLSFGLMNALYANSTWPEMSIFHMNSKWKNHDAKEIKLDTLAGKIVIIAMVYTSCQHTCPMIISKVNQVKNALPKELQNKVKLVLISFDPKQDTPEALKAFKIKRGLNDNWILMTGTKSGIRQLAAVLGVSYKEESEGIFSHSNVLSVINKEGVVVSRIDELNANTDEMVKQIVTLFEK